MPSYTVTFTALLVALVANIGGVNASPASLDALAARESSASFGINFGQTWNNHVAWVDGNSKCNNVVVAPVGTNPCSREFSINGQGGFTLEGCGGNAIWVNQNHNFYANCGPLKEGDQCGVKSVYHCF